ncbi:MAG TPA: hypothetical protein VFY92_07185 [Hyphomicrobiaceae bacterium]|nr:hypothetical protein [Hyphomicrobiaceae bacterium]
MTKQVNVMPVPVAGIEPDASTAASTWLGAGLSAGNKCRHDNRVAARIAFCLMLLSSFSGEEVSKVGEEACR